MYEVVLSTQAQKIYASTDQALDGQPMADSTIVYQWITKIQGGCAALFKDDLN